MIEDRRRIAVGSELSRIERERLTDFLKVVANSTSYGIFAEMVRQELPAGQRQTVEVFGLDKPFDCSINAPERPGAYSFPPLAAIITGGARLMLAILECCVNEHGGSYAMCDTDSMAIVATEDGGLLPCPGGSHRTVEGKEAIRALGWSAVERIRERFASLNPYDSAAVPGSILELEGDNFDDESQSRQLYCYAISAKRYALYNLKARGQDVILRKYSEHGLGHLLDPSKPIDQVLGTIDVDSKPDLSSEVLAPGRQGPRRWTADVWTSILLGDALSRDASLPTWANRPAVARITASSPVVLRPFRHLNQGRPYAEQIKPFNFLLAVHVAPFGLPDGIEADRFQLVAPFAKDPGRWLEMDWYTLYPCSRRQLHDSVVDEGTPLPAGTPFRIHAGGGLEVVNGASARVKTIRDVITEYRHHPEPKSLGPDGQPCGRSTRGLLRRRPVAVRTGSIRYIGKESNRLEDVQSGLVHDRTEVLTEYPDPAQDPWVHRDLPELRNIGPAELRRRTGVPLSTIKHVLAGRHPSAANRGRLAAALIGPPAEPP